MSQRNIILLATPYLILCFIGILSLFISPLISGHVHMAEIPRVESYEIDFSVERSPVITGKLRSPFPEKKVMAYPPVPLKEIVPPVERRHHLSLIMINPDIKLAILDGFILKEGDAVADMRILRITEKGVWISENGVEKIISMPDEKNIRIVR